MAIQDLNGDSKQDLVVANSASNNVSVLLGNGSGSFGAATNFAVGSAPASVAVGDFNHNGKYDLVIANNSSNNVSVLLNTTVFPVAKMAFTTQPSNSLAYPGVMAPVVVTCYDSFGNVVPGAQVNLSLQTGGTLTGATTVTTNAQGQAVFTTLSVALPGTYSFLAEVSNPPGLNPSVVTLASTSFTISANLAATRLRKR